MAISLGNGTTVEADDVQGVTTMQVGSRFQYAAVLPGLQGFTRRALCARGHHDGSGDRTNRRRTGGPGRRCPGTRSTPESTSATRTPTATTTA